MQYGFTVLLCSNFRAGAPLSSYWINIASCCWGSCKEFTYSQILYGYGDRPSRSGHSTLIFARVSLCSIELLGGKQRSMGGLYLECACAVRLHASYIYGIVKLNTESAWGVWTFRNQTSIKSKNGKSLVDLMIRCSPFWMWNAWTKNWEILGFRIQKQDEFLKPETWCRFQWLVVMNLNWSESRK